MSILNRGHARHGAVLPKIAMVSGQFYSSRLMYGAQSAVATAALTAGQHYAVPFAVPAPLTVDQIALNVTISGGAGKLLRLGVYGALANGQPGALLADSGALAADSVAVMAATIAVTFLPGVQYWLTVLSDGTPTTSNLNGVSAPFGNTSASDGAARPGVQRAQAYGALPDPFGTSGVTFPQNCPYICVRAV